jgi:outer membrane protein assembly factor BamE (lipoprotein component of BamABCDE complex)
MEAAFPLAAIGGITGRAGAILLDRCSISGPDIRTKLSAMIPTLLTLTRRPRPSSARRYWHGLALALSLGAAALAGGCEAEVHTRGNMVTQRALGQIQVGQTSRAQVTNLLGTPSTTSLFDAGETWIYIGAYTRQASYHAMEELERQVIAVSFDNAGMVSDVRTLSKDDGTDITVVERQTPTAGNELTIIEQMLGNVGRFSGGSESSAQGVTRR